MRCTIALCSCVAFSVIAQEKAVWEDRPALLLSNDKLELTVMLQGGAMAQVLLVGDPEKISPLWNPFRLARESGSKRPTGFAWGHFVCVDGFGSPSPEERAAGLPGHGEAYTLPWELRSHEKRGATLSATFSVTLPLAQEIFTRTFRMVDAENVVWVESELESLLSLDRPAFWAEHATISAPFLEPGQVVVDMPVHKAKTRAHDEPNPAHQLQSYADFSWPLAPMLDGRLFDVRSAPMKPNTIDHTTSLLDPSRRLVYVTALHPEKKRMIGWVFRREEYPWLQTWLWYPAPGRMTRGLEFATQPFDLPRAEVLRQGPLFDAPVFRILPAKSKISSSFLMFYTRVPDGFRQVDNVSLEGGRLVIDDRTARKTITLAASRRL